MCLHVCVCVLLMGIIFNLEVKSRQASLGSLGHVGYIENL